MTVNLSQNTYDETPYQSYPYSQSSPEHLFTLGHLFGMTPPKLETAKVLELGCAEGGNLIPHAMKHPKGQYVGVDLSKVQIDAGLNNIKALGLKNIELKHISITDIDESFGKFDYIICHGVISWVPEFVRQKIFEICNKNLIDNGIAYVSYNTLPGWNMVRTIRDMMLYHTQGFTNPQEKVSQSRLLLNFVKESLEGATTPYANVLRQEANLLANQSDHYLRHDHLEEENKQFYFNEFMLEASKQDLQYLSDASLSSMYLGNMPASVVEKLQGLNDIVRTEQYMDFITNRRFRSTLLCHKSVMLNRALVNEQAKMFALSLDITPEKPLNEVNLEENSETLKFFFQNNKDAFISSSSAALKAILYCFAENKNNPVNYDKLVEEANAKLGGNKKAQVEADLLSNTMNLVMKGYINIYSVAGKKDKVSLDKPKINKLAAYQATNSDNNWVTNQQHNAVSVNIFDKFAIKYMDGKNTKDQIITKLIEDVNNGKITLSKDNKKLEDIVQIKEEISKYLDNTIERLADQSIFE